MAAPAGDRVDVAAMDAVCAGSAVLFAPCLNTSAARHRLPVRWPAAGRRAAQATTAIVHEAQRARAARTAG